MFLASFWSLTTFREKTEKYSSNRILVWVGGRITFRRLTAVIYLKMSTVSGLAHDREPFFSCQMNDSYYCSNLKFVLYVQNFQVELIQFEWRRDIWFSASLFGSSTAAYINYESMTLKIFGGHFSRLRTNLIRIVTSSIISTCGWSNQKRNTQSTLWVFKEGCCLSFGWSQLNPKTDASPTPRSVLQTNCFCFAAWLGRPFCVEPLLHSIHSNVNNEAEEGGVYSPSTWA